MQYRNKETYTASSVEDMGVTWIKVVSSAGMTVAMLSPEQFADQYEILPESVPE